MSISGNEIRQKYIDFMVKNGHVAIPSAALVPDNDPTTLFTGSGMQPMVPYLLGEVHPMGTRITDSQKCFRAEDIEEVGDNRHTTFFEMLGNWSFGDYTKADQIQWMFDFLIGEIGIDPNKLYISVFGGDEKSALPRDIEAPRIWQELFAQKNIQADVADIGSEQNGYDRGIKAGERIFYYEAKKNWWSRAGVPEKMPAGEPGGPDSEMFYDFGTEHDTKWGTHCHPNCDCGRFMEIGNNVFMEYKKETDGTFSELKSKNIDFGGGLERIAAAANDEPDVFKVDLLWKVVEHIEAISGKKYSDNLEAFRVVTDHIRGAVFMIGDGILPGNNEQSYFVRRLLRRAVRYADVLGIPAGELKNIAESVICQFESFYTNLSIQKANIKHAIELEEEQFRKTLEHGLKRLRKIAIPRMEPRDESTDEFPSYPISGQELFDLFTTFGFPFENSIEEINLIREEFKTFPKLTANQIGSYKKTFDKLMEKHRDESRAGAEHKFKGGLADHSEKVVQYHTSNHLMLAGLRKYLGEHVHQSGSNITGERLRFDFTHSDKIDRETLDKVEQYVNDAIKVGGDVTIDFMPKTQAESDKTVEGSFWDRYPDEVKVYTVTGKDGTVFSRELCGGPHVEKLEDIKGTFKITKEESSSAGVRRIKAILE